MWGIWLNRLGIVLNFAAGFLIAPELIGIERIQRFEERMLARSRKTRAGLALELPRLTGESLAKSSITRWGALLLASLGVLVLCIKGFDTPEEDRISNLELILACFWIVIMNLLVLTAQSKS